MPLSIESFLHHGENSSRQVSYSFLKQEIPTRVAGLLLEFNMLPSILQKQNMVQQVRDDHLETFQELIDFPDKPESSDLERFDETLSNIRVRHAETVSQMAEAVMATKFGPMQLRGPVCAFTFMSATGLFCCASNHMHACERTC